MKIGIPKEIHDGETRVALIPALIGTLKKRQHEVLVESGAGVAASFSDEQYQAAGATLMAGAEELYRNSQVILKVQPPQPNPLAGRHEVELMTPGAVVIAFLDPLNHPQTIALLAARGVTSFAMEYIPRITRAQSMDALSSMATVAGYKAVLIAANQLGKFFPLLMTAAGTIPPATVLILGAGVAGLQAIATARRLGAKVEAFDPRPAVKEQVMSLGAHFVEMEISEDVETAGGYAREQSEEFLRREREAIAARLPKVDAVITTAQVFGKRAPLLITDEMVRLMRPGSVIVDLAAAQGGNCTLTRPRETVVHEGVTIFGTVNLAATLPVHASQMYAKNITNLFLHLYPTADGTFNFQDEITRGACLTHQGAIVNEQVKQVVTSGGNAR
ncbi:MAG: Re/Si-specific NAD(P)(+) transhydrogenase subunit alpha [candidate division KSB1 bacterium]|nr:Re/Si-specific NAD(P)(+) transhydrogenase subunit alpha [candidate division KSB1 bacterium]MDZ7275048.1 Re/Si-specific NAD(P)(+) transhydrogenase subunit alpha [candidate division KSB1 bacterium]MDZ7286504.1 Re/Si-specific NAD(P)(+) transhydrogenase subunit alpha [candidate division KSB1 bacterium]MDZ7299332.1 Re/Si-specific NAD(P)(+) transhydrogenase subunit alpha [candidate division KSB1 bacterium]MDZ7307004.1 Re/Si-specific NAD(P)(+) transhydrogenase subunit alpha [candidate division KSB1